MHICFLCNEYPPVPHGGVGSFTQTLARALVRHGHRATVVGCYSAPKDGVEVDQGVRVVRVASGTARHTGFFVNGHRLQKALHVIDRDAHIDVIEGAENSLSLVSRRFCGRRVIRMHGGHHFFSVTLGRKPRPWRSWLERRSFGRATDLCAVSHFVADTTRRLLNLADRKIEVLPNPVDPSLFHPMAEVPQEDGLILFVGTVCEKKGARQLVLAMADIVAAIPGARLWLVGRDSEDERLGGSFTEGLHRLLPERLRDRVRFHGPIDRASLPHVIARASVCVYPSHMEALPVAWLEGMAMEKAVVASQTGPGPEVIEHGISGLLCNPRDPSHIAQSVITLLNDARLRQRLGEAARRRVLQQFSPEALLERNIAFYRHCLDPAHG